MYDATIKFGIYSDKQNDIDYCFQCCTTQNINKNNYTKINNPNDRSHADRVYTTWNDVFTNVTCDSCHRLFHDIFKSCSGNKYENISPMNMTFMVNSTSGRVNRDDFSPLTRMCMPSSGRVNRDIGVTKMKHVSSGISKNKQTDSNASDSTDDDTMVTFMCNETSGRTNRNANMTYMCNETSGRTNRNADMSKVSGFDSSSNLYQFK